METATLNSHLIASATYDEAVDALLIELTNGATREIRAPRTMCQNLISASSPGWYYIRHIRPMMKQ